MTLFSNYTAQNPVPTSAGSLYALDIDKDRSTLVGFTGEITDLFNSLTSEIVNSSASSPKIIEIYLKRPITTNLLGIGSSTGTFSNTKIIATLGQGVSAIDVTLLDESTDNTDKSVLKAAFEPLTISKITLEFYTTDTITLATFAAAKSQNVTARLQAAKPDRTIEDINASQAGNLNVSVSEFGDTPAIDSFARLRTSNPFTLFDSKQLHDKQPLFFDEDIGGSATSTHDSVDADVEMVVTASASDYIIRQTKQRFNYQPGKSQLAYITFLGDQETGVTKRIGLFDGQGTNYLTPKNGIFLQIDDINISWNIAKNGTTAETVNQSNWNVDSLDGNGISGVTLDLSAPQIMIIDYEWLGVGRVRVGFVIDGLVYYVHYFNHANDPTFSSVYMSTPNLPIRYDIQSDGTGGGELDHICSTVISEGGIEQTGILRSVDTNTTALSASVANTTYAVVGIKLKSAYLDVSVLPEFFSMINTANDDFRWSLCLNPIIAGTFTYNDLDDSSVQFARGITANTVSDEGLVIDSGYNVSSNAGGDSDRKFVTSLRIGSLIDGIQDELVLCVTPLSAGASVYASLTFRELL